MSSWVQQVYGSNKMHKFTQSYGKGLKTNVNFWMISILQIFDANCYWVWLTWLANPQAKRTQNEITKKPGFPTGLWTFLSQVGTQLMGSTPSSSSTPTAFNVSICNTPSCPHSSTIATHTAQHFLDPQKKWKPELQEMILEKRKEKKKSSLWAFLAAGCFLYQHGSIL
jgi:hypothetical protein